MQPHNKSNWSAEIGRAIEVCHRIPPNGWENDFTNPNDWFPNSILDLPGLWNMTRSSSSTRVAPSFVAKRTNPRSRGPDHDSLNLPRNLRRLVQHLLRWRGLLRVGYLFRGLQIVFGRWHDLSISRIYHKLYNARFHYPSFRGFFQTLRFHSRTWFRLLYLSLVIHVLESFCSQADQHVGWAEHVQTPFASNSQLNVTKVCEMRSALLAICTPFPSALNGKEWPLVFCGGSRCLLHSPTSGSFGGGWLSSPQELSMSDCHIWTRGCKRITSSFVKTVSLF